MESRVLALALEREQGFQIIDALPAAVYTTDADGRITHFNRAAVELSGRTPEVGTDCWCFTWKLYYPDGREMPHHECPMAIALREGRAIRGAELIAERSNGERIYVEAYPTPLRDEGGRITGGINMLVDITARKAAEQTRLRLAAIVDCSDDAIISKDLNGIITSWNVGAQRLFGYTAEEAVGQSVEMLIPPDRNEESEILNRIRSGKKIDHYETVRRRKNGTFVDISLTVSPIFDAAGRIIGVSKIARDISERRQAQAREKALREELEARLLERTASLRRTENALRDLSHFLLRSQDDERRKIGRDLHDSVGQSLAILKMNLDLLAPQLGPQQDHAQRHLVECSSITDQVIHEVRTLSYLMHPPLLEDAGLCSTLRWYLEGLEARSRLRINLEIQEPTPRMGMETELALFRVVQESLTNVIRHSGASGAVIRLHVVDSHLVLEIEDNGRGIPSEVLKGPTESSAGVGLHGMRERMRIIHGELEITSSPAGTLIRARVPLTSYPLT